MLGALPWPHCLQLSSLESPLSTLAATASLRGLPGSLGWLWIALRSLALGRATALPLGGWLLSATRSASSARKRSAALVEDVEATLGAHLLRCERTG